MPLRNPFKKAPTALEIHDQNNRNRTTAENGFQDANVKGTKPIEVTEPPEYKLSEINDSGDFVPPSPPAQERIGFFTRTSTSTTTSSHRKALTENEPFNISRESFDSYRRSFDISARSPVSDAPIRQSLDSRRKLNTYSPRPSFQERERRSMQQTFTEPEERFEDVGLNDEAKPQQKKRGLFSRFGESNDNENTPGAETKQNHNFLSGLTSGRKRGQSGAGRELGNIPTRPESRNAVGIEAT